jgi:Glyoxalase-like domain
MDTETTRAAFGRAGIQHGWKTVGCGCGPFGGAAQPSRRPGGTLVLVRSTSAPGNSSAAGLSTTRAAMAGLRLYGGPMASVRKFQVTFDCAEPERVARFWCEVLGYVVPPPPEGFASWGDFDRSLPPERQGSAFACVDPSGVGPRLFFQRVPEGKAVKNRVHLDVRVGTGLVGEERLAALEAESARLVALGAVPVRLMRADGFDESCLVMQDIEGNEFDLD